MIDKTIILEAKDCSSFMNQESHTEAIQYFISQKSQLNLFNFGNERKNEDDYLATFDYKSCKWIAGRYIGESIFNFKGATYKIIINPRFGDVQLFRMLEEIFNIRLSQSNTHIDKSNNVQFLIKKLISLLWVSILSKANKHGIPREYKPRTFKGATIKGRLMVRESIGPFYTESKLVSEYREKVGNSLIANIIYKAFKILKLEFGLSEIQMPTAAKNAIEQISSTGLSDRHISEHEYKSINYKSIYLTYKPIVDLSWDIIKKREFGNKQNEESKSLSFFIDMAEIWEMYLTSLLKKEFISKGWKVHSPKINIYQDKDYRRNIIPDIVVEKGNTALVFDAKYKRMKFDYCDYDRADFFQIHTYLDYFKQNYNVIGGGLLYPFSSAFNDSRIQSNLAESLYSSNKSTTKFLVDGIDLSETNFESMKLHEAHFVKRISNLLQN